MNSGQPIAFGSPLKPSAVLVLLLVYAALWFGTLNYRHLIPSDEGRYAEMAREMLVSGDWITPRYNGYKYFEKPPLQIWATAATFQFFGVGEWQARLWTALTGFATILLIGFTGSKLYGARTGYLAAVALASSPMWIIGGHINSLDMGLSAFLVAALCSLLLALKASDHHSARNWMWCCWISMALACLTKGLIGVALPALVFVAYSLSAWDWRIWKKIHLISGLILFLAIASPWFVLVSQRNPEFLEFFFIYEHLQRFTDDAHSRSGPIYYFIPLLLIGFLPWLWQLGKPVENAWKLRRQEQSSQWLLVCWSVAILIFFSLSHSKLPGYIMPIFPALALLAGIGLDQSLREKNPLPNAWRIQTILFALLGVAGFFFLSTISEQAKPDEVVAYATYSRWIVAALCALIGFCLLSFWMTRKNQDRGLLAISSFAIGVFLCCIIAGTGHETLGRAVSGVDLANRVKNQIPPNANIYSVRILDHTMPFYLGRTMIMVQYPDELEFGVTQEPEKWAPTLENFILRWKQEPDAYALIVPEQYAELQALNLPMQEVDRDARRVIIKHPDPEPSLRQ